MRTSGLLITEIFHSLQGETSQIGIPFVFIRLTGCNLRCVYCDSAYSFKGGKMMEISEIFHAISSFKTRHVLLTGGEPLIQRNTSALVQALHEAGYIVSIETHGETSIQSVVEISRIIMDIKTPSSKMSRGGFEKNLHLLKATDETKFVIASKEDYLWAKTLVESGKIPTREILFSPAVAALDSPGNFTEINPTWLAEKILEDRLPVRFQLQLHKVLWGPNKRGV